MAYASHVRGIQVSSLVAAVLLLTTSAALAAFTTETCLAQKRKAQGKFQKCRATEDAKLLESKPADHAKCSTKFQDKIAKLSEKASEAGIACRYRDNGSTVSDFDTGLQWEKKTTAVGSGENLADRHDVDNLYSWSETGTTVPNGEAFGDFLGGLNNCTAGAMINQAGFAFNCDWRLPTLAELQTILLEPFPCGTNPCIDPIFGPTGGGSHNYWTRTTITGTPTGAWNVFFDDGDLGGTAKAGSAVRVRAVRGGL